MLNLFLNNVEDMQFKGIKSYSSRFLVRIPLKPQAKPAFYLKHIFGCKCNVNTLTSALIQIFFKKFKKIGQFITYRPTKAYSEKIFLNSSNGNQIIKLHCSLFTGQFSGNAKLHMLKDVDARRNRSLYKHTRVISLNKIA